MTFLEHVFATPEFTSALVTLAVGVFSYWAAVMARKLAQLKVSHEETKADVARAAHAAESTSVQVSNTHPTNLRDDIDQLTALISRVESKMDESEAKAVLWRNDHAKKQDHERFEREQYDARAEAHIDMLRHDMQGVIDRYSREHDILRDEHRALHDRITRLKQDNRLN